MTDFQFNPDHKNYKDTAASGFVFSGATQAIKIITQFLTIIVMARLLSPEDFGLMAMVMPVFAFAAMFNNLGVSNAILQRPTLDHAQVNALFWLSSGVGLLITLILCAISPLVAMFYDDPRALPLTIALALLVFIGGLGMQHGTLVQRRLMFKVQAIVQIVSTLFGALAGIVFAFFTQSYWALYVGMAVTSLTAFIGTWISIPWRPGKPAWAEGATDMLKFGLGIASGNFMGFIVNNVSVIAIGKAFGTHVLGLYDRSNKILLGPIQQATFPISGVVVPILHRVYEDQEKYKRVFLRTVALLMFMISPGVIWAVLSAEHLIPILLGDEWSEAIPLFAILSLCAIPRLLNTPTRWIFETQGRSAEFAKSGFWVGIGKIISILAAIPFGIMAVVISFTVFFFASTPYLWWYASRKGAIKLMDVIDKLLPLFSGLAFATLCVSLFPDVSSLSTVVSLGVTLLLSYFVTLLGILIFPSGRETIRADFEFALFIVQKIFKKNAAREPKI